MVMPIERPARHPPPPPVNSGIGQPVEVAALSSTEPYVFVDALRTRNIGKPTFIFEWSSASGPGLLDSPGSHVAVRTVFKVDVRTGRIADDVEVFGPLNGITRLLADQQGRLRLAAWTRDLGTQFAYVGSSGNRWRPMEEAVPATAALRLELDAKNYLGHRSVPLAFDYDANVLYFASNVGRDTYGVYGLDLGTGRRNSVAVESPALDLVDPFGRDDHIFPDCLVFDRWKQRLAGMRIGSSQAGTIWFDGEVKAIQAGLERTDSTKRWEILEWDASRGRFIVLGSTDSDPGAYYLLDRKQGTLTELFKRAPSLDPAMLGRRVAFSIGGAGGIPLTGFLTLPNHPRLKQPPVVVLCHDGPWMKDMLGLDPQAEALPSVGFAVLQVNFRGSAGFGTRYLNAAREGFDTAPLQDILACLDWVHGAYGLNRQLAAIMGRGYGGYLALRALQLHPERFQCGVAIDAPVDLEGWINPALARRAAAPSFLTEVRLELLKGADLKALSPASHPELLTKPVMIVQGEGNPDAPAWQGLELKDALERRKLPVTYLALTQSQDSELPAARAGVYAQIGDFLNTNIYDYAVKIGELVEKE